MRGENKKKTRGGKEGTVILSKEKVTAYYVPDALLMKPCNNLVII